MQERYFYCSHCGNIAVKVKDAGVPLVCCGSPMTELEAGAVDASLEKHVPVVKREGNVATVQVGETLHPSLPEHYIEWIALHTRQGIQRQALDPAPSRKRVSRSSTGTKSKRLTPIATFTVCGKNDGSAYR